MSGFASRLRCEDLPGDSRRLLARLVYHAAGGVSYVVPEGFVSDGASIPRLLWTLLGHPWAEPHGRAAVLHDWLYATGLVTRARADALFLESLQALEVGRVKRWTLCAGVRAGGWLAWRRHRQRDRWPTLA